MNADFDNIKINRASTSKEKPNNEVKSALNDVVDKIEQNQSRMIFLSGTSTAGKSTLMAAFAKHHANAVELGTDDFEEARCAFLIKTHCPDHYAILSQAIDDKHLYLLINSHPDFVEANPEVFFKTESSELQREAAIKLNRSDAFFSEVSEMLKKHKPSQDKEHFEGILKYSAEGKTVIFDSPNAKGFFEHLRMEPFHAPVQRFLVYVPLPDLVNRISGRNEQAIKSGNQSNQRQYIDILNQFKHVYRKAEEDDVKIDVLKRVDIEKIFNEHKDSIENENKNARENNRGDYALEKEQFLNYFGFGVNVEEVHITSVDNVNDFDGIFRTATQSPEVTAHQLSSYTWDKL